MVPLLIGILVGYGYRDELFGQGIRDAGPDRDGGRAHRARLALARDVGRALGPTLFRRLDPGPRARSASSSVWSFVGFAILVALRVAGLDPRTLAVGGAFTAVIVGLAAQQTLGNLIAGTVLLSARPFRVGERVRLQGGGIAGQIEGIVSSLGLLYTTFAQGEDHVMIPNSSCSRGRRAAARARRRRPARAAAPRTSRPLEVQELLEQAIQTPVRGQPQITLEELDGDEVVVRISATPERPSDGPRLASEVLEAVATQTGRAA